MLLQKQARWPRELAGMTLIELLVVIAIIGVLAGILFPVFAAARGKARQTQCLSNLRQLSVALRMYVDDHEGAYPYNLGPRAPARPGALTTDTRNRWDASPVVGVLLPYLATRAVAYCPDRPKTLPDVGPLTNYEYNGYLAVNPPVTGTPPQPYASQPVMDSDIVDPSHVLTFEDYSDSPKYHAGYRNFAMADGRVAAYPVSMQGAPPCHAKWWY